MKVTLDLHNRLLVMVRELSRKLIYMKLDNEDRFLKKGSSIETMEERDFEKCGRGYRA